MKISLRIFETFLKNMDFILTTFSLLFWRQHVLLLSITSFFFKFSNEVFLAPLCHRTFARTWVLLLLFPILQRAEVHTGSVNGVKENLCVFVPLMCTFLVALESFHFHTVCLCDLLWLRISSAPLQLAHIFLIRDSSISAAGCRQTWEKPPKSIWDFWTLFSLRVLHINSCLVNNWNSS